VSLDWAGPRERPRRPESTESSKTYPGAIWLGPWIIAVNSPAHGIRRTDPASDDRPNVCVRLGPRPPKGALLFRSDLMTQRRREADAAMHDSGLDSPLRYPAGRDVDSQSPAA
jgi:hypothetical protein